MSPKASPKAINQPKLQAKRITTVNNVIAKFGGSLVHIVAELNKRGKLHGIDHFVNKRYHPVERILWFALVIAAFCGVFFIGNNQMKRYVANPTVISIERDSDQAWNGSIPALTFCYHNRYDEVKAKKLIQRLWNIDELDNEYSYFLDYVKAVVNTSVFSFKTLNRFVNDKRFEYLDMLIVAKDVHPNVKVEISGFDPNYKPPIVQIITEMGICYAINAVLEVNLMSTGSRGLLDINKERSITCSYKSNQCFMKIEVLDPTMQYTIHSPYEVITQNSIFIEIGATDGIENTFNVVETVASDSLRPLTTDQRKCQFYEELHGIYQGYSVNVCRLKCRADAAIKLCGCRPHFYPFINGTSCSPSGLLCLSINLWPGNANCQCLKTCSELVYTPNMLKRINLAADSESEMSDADRNPSLRYEILAQKFRYRRDILFSFEDLIVSFGGIAALFLGYNFWNTSNMVYYVLDVTIKYLYKQLYT